MLFRGSESGKRKRIFSCTSQGHYLLLLAVISISIYIFNAILRSGDTLRGQEREREKKKEQNGRGRIKKVFSLCAIGANQDRITNELRHKDISRRNSICDRSANYLHQQEEATSWNKAEIICAI